MAPEQHADGKQADARSDVWSLGVTLYELLTLQRAFRDRTAVLETEPTPPRQLTPALDRDLEAVVLKALRKDPAQRYPTAQALADDLNHWLNHQPVQARPAHALRRAAMWSRRNKGWAAAIGLALMGCLSLSVFAEVKREHALEREQAKERQLELLDLQRQRLAPHSEGWFAQAWGLVRQLAARKEAGGPVDYRLQQEAAGCLIGLDVEPVQEFKDFGARSAAMDSQGRLVLGGVTDSQDSRKRLGARFWDGVSPASPRDLGVVGDGPSASAAMEPRSSSWSAPPTDR